MKPGGPETQAAREARLAERRARLSAEQQSLLAERLRPRAPQGATAAGRAMPAVSASLVAIQPAGSRPPFFCVHPAGGDVLCFQALSRHLGEDQPFYGLQSRGLGAGEEPLESIEAMAAAYREEIARVSAGPYHLGGWSLGGAVVFELARQLAESGGEVALLAIVDGTPGTWPPPENAPENAEATGEDESDARWLLDIADYLERLWGLDLGFSPETFRALPPEEQQRRFLAGLQKTPFATGAGPEPLRRLLRVFKTNVRAFRRYQPGSYPGRITLFQPAEALAGDAEIAAAATATAADPTLGWGALTPLPVALESVPGDHISALAEPHVAALAARLRTAIDEVSRPL